MKKKTTAQPFQNNPRQITARQKRDLEVSMATYGDLSGIVVNRRTNQIVGGNQRSSIIDLNEAEIEIIEEYKSPDHQGTVAWGFVYWNYAKYSYREVQWTEEYERAANILANKLGGTWDMAVLEANWTKEELLQLGWAKSELKWFNDPDSYAGQVEIAGAGKKIHTKLGDLYQLNDHRLLCGSATSEEDQDKVLEGDPIDLVLTDPPYNVNYQGRSGNIQNDNMPDDRFRLFLRDFYENTSRATRPGSVWYIFHADSKGHIFRDEFIAAGNYLAQCLVWTKHHFVIGRSDYHWQHEPALYGFTPDKKELKRISEILAKELGGEPAYYQIHHQPIIYGWTAGKHTWNSNRSQSTVLKFDKPLNSKQHPTIKPVNMLEYLIENSSQPGQLVWDPFNGSGSTLIAAEKQRRIFAGIDIAPHHIDQTIRRWVTYKQNQQEDYTVRKNGKDITKQRWIHG